MSKVCLPVGRVVYCHLNEPSAAVEGAKPFYSITVSFPEGTDLSAIEGAIEDTASDKFKTVPKNLTSPLKNNGDRQREDGSLPSGFHEGGYHITLKQERLEDVALRTLDLADATGSDFYAGCWVQAIGHFHAYKVTNPGVTVYLKGLRFVKEDSPIGGARVEFDEIPEMSITTEASGNTPF